jgi:hypothetical protein
VHLPGLGTSQKDISSVGGNGEAMIPIVELEPGAMFTPWRHSEDFTVSSIFRIAEGELAVNLWKDCG